jgi:hypothetical protein
MRDSCIGLCVCPPSVHGDTSYHGEDLLYIYTGSKLLGLLLAV